MTYETACDERSYGTPVCPHCKEEYDTETGCDCRNLQAGTIVRYAKPEAGEETMLFAVVEHNGDRVLIRPMVWLYGGIVPLETVATRDVVPHDNPKTTAELFSRC